MNNLFIKTSCGKLNDVSIKPNTTPCIICGDLITGYRQEREDKRYYCTAKCYQSDRKNIPKKARSDSGKRPESWMTLPCEQCGQPVEFLKSDLKNHSRRFCNTEHQLAWFAVNGADYRKRDAQGRMVGRPIGSTMLTNHGYVMEKTETGWRQQHRVVMERILGRPLVGVENVHHKNGIKTDNRPENLELWVKSQPSGTRVPDALAWAWELIERHDPDRLTDPHKKDDDVLR